MSLGCFVLSLCLYLLIYFFMDLLLFYFGLPLFRSLFVSLFVYVFLYVFSSLLLYVVISSFRYV